MLQPFGSCFQRTICQETSKSEAPEVFGSHFVLNPDEGNVRSLNKLDLGQCLILLFSIQQRLEKG